LKKKLDKFIYMKYPKLNFIKMKLPFDGGTMENQIKRDAVIAEIEPIVKRLGGYIRRIESGYGLSCFEVCPVLSFPEEAAPSELHEEPSE
jgi:hypothetical protein